MLHLKCPTVLDSWAHAPFRIVANENMAVSLLRLHHVAFHVLNGEKFTYDLVSKYKFNLFATRLTDRSRQVAFRKGAAVFVVQEGPRSSSADTNEWLLGESPHVHGGGKYHRGNNSPPCLYDAGSHHPVDSVSNVCFEVEDVERSFKVLRDLGCSFLVPPTTVEDENGLVTYSVVKSVVGNVCHTLIDKSKYGGVFLPGFNTSETDWSLLEEDVSCPVTHFDHITYASPQRSTPQIMRWYEKMFGFKRFFIVGNEDENDGFVVSDKGIGLRLTAMQYWKCSELGISLPFTDKKEPDCKFVIAESLPNSGPNQVETFLEQHKGPGIQHIALSTKNIVSTTHAMAEAGVQFFSPPAAYYTEVGKRQEMEEVGHTPQMLSQHGILLDADLNQGPSSPQADTRNRKYLLQVFTKPLFDEDTFFLELIERRGATGFGEGNIRALWRSVQVYMENERVVSQREGAIKAVQTAQY